MKIRKIDRQIDKQIDSKIDRQINRQIVRQIDRKIDRQIDRQTERQIDRQIDRKIDRQIDRQLDRQINVPKSSASITIILGLVSPYPLFKPEYPESNTTWCRGATSTYLRGRAEDFYERWFTI